MFSVALQPMVLLLLASTVLYALLGSTFDSAVLSLSIIVIAAISVYQELRTERVLATLRDLASPRSTVVRDDVFIRVASQDLVEGDRLIVQRAIGWPVTQVSLGGSTPRPAAYYQRADEDDCADDHREALCNVDPGIRALQSRQLGSAGIDASQPRSPACEPCERSSLCTSEP